MASSKWHAIFHLYLVLSNVAPGSYARRIIAKQQSAGSEDQVHDALGLKNTHCPMGLTPGNETCSYPLLAEGSQSSVWSGKGSQALLMFEPKRGVFLLESQFLVEMAVAFTDSNLKLRVANALAKERMQIDEDFKKAYEESRQEELSKREQFEEDFTPGYFLLEDKLKEAVLEGLVQGFELVAERAAESTLRSSSIVLAGAMVGKEALEFVLHYVMPVLLPIETAMMVWTVHKHFKEQKERAEDFSSRMIFESKCMVQKLQAFKEKEGVLKKDISKICTAGFAQDLEEQLKYTAQAKIELFEEIAVLGGCLRPEGKRTWAKSSCVEAVYYKLLQSDGKSGILYEALAFIAYYGSRVDELLVEPHYLEMHKDALGIEKHTEDTSLLPQLHRVDGKPFQERLPVCMQVLATHRAFQRTFLRLKAALRVWTQTFAREYVIPSIRSSWWPCQKVFYKIEDSEKGMCKNLTWPEEDLGPESEVCESAANYKGSWWPETEEANEANEKEEEKDEEGASLDEEQ